MDEIIQFCIDNCINLEEHNGVHSYAMSSENILKYIDLLENQNIFLHGIDIVYLSDGIYNYLTLPNEYVHWNIENTSIKERCIFFKEKISNFNSKRSVAFVPIDDITYIAWKTINHDRIKEDKILWQKN